MKQLAKGILMSAVLILALMLCACSQESPQTAPQGSEKTPYEQGLKLIGLITEMAGSETYQNTVTSSAEIMNQAAVFAAGDRTAPLAVYAITVNEALIQDSMIESVGQADWNSMSNELRAWLLRASKNAIISQINAQSGSSALAAASLCTASKSFVSSALTEDVIYLYTYRDAVSVAITFTVGDNGYIGASATFMANEKLDCSSAEGIENFFNTGMDLVQVQKLTLGGFSQ